MIQDFGPKFKLITSGASENKIYKETWDFYHFYLCEKNLHSLRNEWEHFINECICST